MEKGSSLRLKLVANAWNARAARRKAPPTFFVSTNYCNIGDWRFESIPRISICIAYLDL